MLAQLLIAFALTSVTVLLHALGMFEAIRQVARVRKPGDPRPGDLRGEIQIVRMVSILLLLHLLEAASWACYYAASGLLPDLETSVYFSLTSYTTVGYGDIVLPAPSRLLGPIEGAVGILMFGWSTALMVAAIPRIYAHRLRSLDAPRDNRA